MKVIDLLNKIANNEIGYYKKIRINNEIIDVGILISSYVFDDKVLNDEVEILEEEKKIPEKLDLILDEQFTNDELQAYIYETQVKTNEIIDYLKSKGE